MQHARTCLAATTLVALTLVTALALPATIHENPAVDTAAQHTTSGFSDPAAAK